MDAPIPRGARACALIGLAATLFAISCLLPTERSAELAAEFDSFGDLIVGERTQFHGQVVDGAGHVVPNGALAFESADPAIAEVEPDGRVTAVTVGETIVTARVVGYTGAAADARPLRVRDRIAIDSVRPALVRFGDTLEIFGTGLNPAKLLVVSLGPATVPVKAYVPDDPDAPDRIGRLTVWAAPPAAPRSQVAVIGVDGIRASPETTLVEQRDLYEPNDSMPWDFGELSALDSVLNPALAFEPIAREDTAGVDWYRFAHASAHDRTIVLKPGTAGPASYAAFITDSLEWSSGGSWRIGRSAWTIGPKLFACGGFPFTPQQRVPDSTVVALRGLPAGSYDVLSVYVREGSYGFAILPGYVSVLPPDDAEENDFCNVATLLLPGGRTQNLTIDNPFEVDWFRFRMTASGLAEFLVAPTDTSALLDLYLFRNGLPDSLPEVARRLASPVPDALTVNLTQGEYFLVVVDFAGHPTPYALTTRFGPLASAGGEVQSGAVRGPGSRQARRPASGAPR